MFMKSVNWICVFVSVLAITIDIGSALGEQTKFSRDVQPILKRHCLACHGGVKRASGLSFLSREATLAPAESGDVPIVPNHPEKSQVITRITSNDVSVRMPPPDHGAALTSQEIDTLRQWINEGANWEKHWAYRPPLSANLPDVQDKNGRGQDLEPVHFGATGARECQAVTRSRSANLDSTSHFRPHGLAPHAG